MIRYDEYIKLDATDMATLVRQRELTPTELLEISYQRYRMVNPGINAVTTSMYTNARRYTGNL